MRDEFVSGNKAYNYLDEIEDGRHILDEYEGVERARPKFPDNFGSFVPAG